MHRNAVLVLCAMEMRNFAAGELIYIHIKKHISINVSLLRLQVSFYTWYIIIFIIWIQTINIMSDNLWQLMPKLSFL